MSEKDKKKKPAAPVRKKTAKEAIEDATAEKKPVKAKAAAKKLSKKASPEKKPVSAKKPAADAEKEVREITFKADEPFEGSSGSSGAKATQELTGPASEIPPAEIVPAVAEATELSPLFRKLANADLPDLPRENRARLQMQSPTRLYFYWSIKNNPFRTLNQAFGEGTVAYTLVVKLINHSRGTEELHRVDPEGNWWFAAEPDCLYRAEVGFYSTSRPYIRIIVSNHIRTPRRSPSWRTDYTPRFTVSADQFAEVLDVSGYQRDAFEVALAGDDRIAADNAADGAFRKLLGNQSNEIEGSDGNELRFVLLALASGYSLEQLKDQISDALFAKLVSLGARFSAEQAMAALQEFFDVETGEVEEIEEIGPAVFGLSAINFPKRVKTRTVPKKLLNRLSRFDTVSSSR